MKEYSYKEIKEITEIGILFKDDFELLFEECRNEWCIGHNLKKRRLPLCCRKKHFSKNTLFFILLKKQNKNSF